VIFFAGITLSPLFPGLICRCNAKKDIYGDRIISTLRKS
jgi:hypothetical protein